MPETDLIHTLEAARDLGLGDQQPQSVDAKCRTALQQEFVRAESGERPRRRRRPVVALFGVLLAGGVAAVAYAALTNSSTASDGVGCYADSTLSGNATILGLDGRPATQTCAELWAAGDVVSGVNKAPAPLHACVEAEGGGPIHVLASHNDGICQSVGLVEDPRAGADPTARQFGAFSAELNHELERDAFACVGPARMRQLVERLLKANDLTGWTINDTGGYDEGTPCASLALDSDARTVTLIADQP